jgi:hypothetical protein
MDSYLLKNSSTGHTYWIRKYHLSKQYLRILDLITLKDKNLLLSGTCNYYYPYPSSNGRGVILKTDTNGLAHWCRIYPGHDIQKTLSMRNGDVFILARDSTSALKIILMDLNGNIKWCRVRTGGIGASSYGLAACEGTNKNILISGQSASNSSYLILLDSMGNTINSLDISNNTNTPLYLYKIVNYFNQGYVACGTSNGFWNTIAGNILRLDNSLNIVWYKKYATGNDAAEFMDIVLFGNNNLMILTEPEGHGVQSNTPRMGFTFIDSSGAIRKSVLLTKDSFPNVPNRSIHLGGGKLLYCGGGYHCAGCIENNYYGVADTASAGFCGNDTTSWLAVPPSEIFTYTTFITANSSFTFYPSSIYFYPSQDVVSFYACSNGPQGPQDPFPTGLSEHSLDGAAIYPNPAKNLVSIDLGGMQFSGSANVRFYDYIGREVFRTEIPYLGKSIDVSSITPGIYFVRIDFGRFISCKKLIIEE